ncbi:MAG: YkgJ family cysteine cluster protein [Desulfopila sp.]
MIRRTQVLATIYAVFADWSASRPWACRQGCACCCTQNVTVTTPEALEIIDFIRQHQMQEWLWARLAGDLQPNRPRYTLNTMARASLARKELAEEGVDFTSPCPFLDTNRCSLYPVRPFACRSFLSRTPCTPDRPAEVDSGHLAAVTAVSQLLEHFGQRQPWGNMLDLLELLLKGNAPDSPAHRHTLRAQPFPGFLLTPDEERQIGPCIQRILAAKVGATTIEAILNGVGA